MTRTKTPKQIHEQTIRIAKKLVRINDEKAYQRILFIGKICLRYIDNIYAANGIIDVDILKERIHDTNIWANAATPVSVYTKRV